MHADIRAKEMEKLEDNIKNVMTEKLDVLSGQCIISKADAKEFAIEIGIAKKPVEKVVVGKIASPIPKPSVDYSCGGGRITRGFGCS